MIVCMPDVLDLTELRKIRGLVGDSRFVDGKTTAGYRAKRVKNNEQLAKNDKAAEEARSLILTGLTRNPTFKQVSIPRTVQRPLISRYVPGMTYGRHVDDALMGGDVRVRTDLSATVFLSGPEDYDGGELLIDSPFGEQAVKLPAGAAVLYPSGALHRVAEVTRGERLAGVTWIQSFIRDPAKRELLSDLNGVCQFLTEQAPDTKETDLAFKTYSNLLRMWSEL